MLLYVIWPFPGYHDSGEKGKEESERGNKTAGTGERAGAVTPVNFSLQFPRVFSAVRARFILRRSILEPGTGYTSF